jgi:maltose O-acetyltransferase
MVVQTERKNDCRSFYSAGDAVLVKDRRRAKNLLHRLNVTEYRVTKSTGNLKLIPNAGANFCVNRLFIVITAIILRVARMFILM